MTQLLETIVFPFPSPLLLILGEKLISTSPCSNKSRDSQSVLSTLNSKCFPNLLFIANIETGRCGRHQLLLTTPCRIHRYRPLLSRKYSYILISFFLYPRERKSSSPRCLTTTKLPSAVRLSRSKKAYEEWTGRRKVNPQYHILQLLTIQESTFFFSFCVSLSPSPSSQSLHLCNYSCRTHMNDDIYFVRVTTAGQPTVHTTSE